MKGIIYKWTCSKSGKSYIGQTTNESRREKEFLTINEIYTTSGSKIDNAREKYGVDKSIWKKEVLKRLWCKEGKEDELLNRLNYWEKYYIEKYDTFNSGYNSTDGGSNGFLISDETKEKLKINGLIWWNNLNNVDKEKYKLRGVERWNSLSTKEKNIIRENGKKWWNSLSDKEKKEHKEKSKYWLNKNLNSDVCTKIREKHIGLTKSEKTKDKIRKSLLSQNLGKPVKQFDLDGNLIKEYASISEAAKLNCLKERGIVRCARGLQKKSKGYVWKFSNEEDKAVRKRENKGYYFHKRLNKYKSRLRINGKEYNLGFYRNENAASAIYKLALKNKDNIDEWFKNIENEKQNIIKLYDT